MFVADLDRRKARRQRAARHDVLGLDLDILIVEEGEIAGSNIDGAEAEPHGTMVDAVEIDMVEQGLAQLLGVIDAGRARRTPRLKPGWDLPGRKEARHTEGRYPPTADRAIEMAGLALPLHQEVDRQLHADLVPEGAQFLQPLARHVARHDRGVDRADRDAGDPVRLDVDFPQCFESTGLVGAESAAALQDEDLLRIGRSGIGGEWSCNIHGSILCCAPP